MSFSIASRTWSRRHENTDIGTTVSSRCITRCGLPLPLWRSATSGRLLSPRLANRDKWRTRASLPAWPTLSHRNDPTTPPRIAWAKLLARIAEAFPLGCPACGGDIRLIAFITDRGGRGFRVTLRPAARQGYPFGENGLKNFPLFVRDFVSLHGSRPPCQETSPERLLRSPDRFQTEPRPVATGRPSRSRPAALRPPPRPASGRRRRGSPRSARAPAAAIPRRH